MIAAFINKLDLLDFNHGYGNGYVAVSMNELKLSHLAKLVYDNDCTVEVHVELLSMILVKFVLNTLVI